MNGVTAIFGRKLRGEFMAGSVTTKLLYQNCDTFMQAGLKKKDRIDEDQLQLINGKRDMGFLGIRWEKTATRNVFRYNVSNMTALSEYIKQTMPQEKYFSIINQFQKIYEFCARTEGLSADNLLLSDLKNVYYDVEKQKVFVAYLPLSENIYKCSNVVKFLYKLNKNASITITNGTVMQKYGFFLEDLMAKQNSKTPKNGGLSYAQLYTLLHDVLSILVEDPVPAADTAAEAPSPAAAGGADAPMDDDGDHTILVSRRSSDCLAFLKDDSNREFPIDHVPFTIGRRPDNDLSLTDKGTVSKVHAAIGFEDGEWFVEDRGSANGTFLNDFAENARRISKETINSGDVIYIYDAPFVFTVNSGDAATVIVGAAGKKQEPPKNKVKKIAYFINGSSNERIPVFVYPFTCAELSGVVIDRESNGSRHNICIENISCNSLSVEGSDVPAGEKTVIFSGCNFLYHGISYTFYEEN